MTCDQRSGAAPARGRPSARAEQRLREALRRDVADTRVRLHEAQLRGDALAEAGLPDAAALVVDEQRALVAALRIRVEDVVAAAAVEREAEWVVGGVPGAGGPPPAATGAAPGRPPSRRPFAAVAGAVLAAVVAAATFLVAAPHDAGGTLAGADGPDPGDAGGGADTTATDRTARSAIPGPHTSAFAPGIPGAPVAASGSGVADGLRPWFGGDPDGTSGGPPGTVTPLPDMDDVIDRVLASARIEAPSAAAAARASADDALDAPTAEAPQPDGATAADPPSAPDRGATTVEPEPTATADEPASEAPPPSDGRPASEEGTASDGDDEPDEEDGEDAPAVLEDDLSGDLGADEVADELDTP